MLGTWGVFTAASTPILKVIAIAVTGALAAWHRTGILTQDGVKSLSRLIINILVPCFLFTKLGSTVTPEKLAQWWLICFYVFLNNLCGFALGFAIVSLLPRQVGRNRSLVLAMCSLGNVGQIPLALSSAACTDGLDKFAGRETENTCEFDAEAMVGFGISMGSLAVWTLGRHWLRPCQDEDCQDAARACERVKARTQGRASAGYAELDEECGRSPGSGLTASAQGCTRQRAAQGVLTVHGDAPPPNSSADTTLAAETVGIATSGGADLMRGRGGATGAVDARSGDDAGTPATAGYIVVARPADSTPRDRVSRDPAAPKPDGFSVKLRGWGSVAYGLISPPIVAALAGLFVGCTPFKALFYGAGAPLSVLTEAMGTLSMAMIPCMLLLLGANMLPSSLSTAPVVKKADSCSSLQSHAGGGGAETDCCGAEDLKRGGDEGQESATMPLVVVAGIIATRLVCLPMVGLAFMSALKRLGVVTPSMDPLVEFVCLVQFSVPSAAQLNTIATINGLPSKRLVSRLTLYQYSFSAVTLTGYMMLFLTYQV